MKERGRCDQGIFTRHGAIRPLQVRQQLFPPDQDRFRKRLGGGIEGTSRLRKPGNQSGPVGGGGAFDPELQLREGHNTQENLSVVVLNPRRQLLRNSLPFKKREKIGIDEETHLNGSGCRSGSSTGLGHLAN